MSRMVRTTSLLAVLVGTAALASLPTSAPAQDWTGTSSGNWFDPANWSTGTVPAIADAVRIDTTAPNSTAVDAPGALSLSLIVGHAATGVVAVTNGGGLTSTFGTLGHLAGSSGTVAVSGANTEWYAGSQLVVGGAGAGALTISNGGIVNNSTGRVADSTGSTGLVNVDGAGSTWNNGSFLIVGSGGSGTLNVTAGGTVTSAYAQVGLSAPGRVSIDGAGSTWTNTFDLVVGSSDDGRLTISNGGAVSNSFGYVGGSHIGFGQAIVDGLGSSWTNANLTIGEHGNGALTIANRGTVSVAGLFTLASEIGSFGTLNIGAAAGSAAAAPGTLDAAAVQFGAGTGVLTFNHTAANYLFAPSIGGSGTINHIAGNTTLNADSAGFTGAANVTGGRLAVNGSLASAAVTVAGSGALGGSGTVGSVVVQNGGTIAPGNSIGTLTVNGNLTQAAGSVYQVELTSTGQVDLVRATGTATIANGAQLKAVKLDSAPYVVGTQYTVLQADGGVSGAYTMSGGISPFLGLAVSYDPTHVYLSVVQTKSFAAAGLMPNQVATGGAAQGLGAGNPIHQALLNMPTEAAARAAFDQLSGEVHPSTAGMLMDESLFLRSAILGRLRQAPSGNAGMTPLAAGGPQTAFADAATESGFGGRTPITTKPAALAAPSHDVTFWAQGFGAWGRFDTDGNAATARRDLAGVISGFDTRVGRNGRLGVAAGYGSSKYALDARGSADVETGHVAAYGGWSFGAVNLRAGGAYAFHAINTDRTIAFPGFFDRATASYDGATGQIFGELGYGLALGNLAIEPFAGAAWARVKTDATVERGGPAALGFAGATLDTGYSTLGLRAAGMLPVAPDMVLIPRGSLAWQHAFDSVTPIATLAFQNAPSPFSIAGVPIARDAMLAEAGLDLVLGRHVTLGVSYVGQHARTVHDHAAKGKFSVRF